MESFLIGAARAVGTVALTAFLSYVGAHIVGAGLVPNAVALLISSLALALEHSIETSSGNALFGAVRSR